MWQRGKLVGHKCIFSDRMLMFLLRQYGVDDRGRNVTVNYVRTRAAVAEKGAALSDAEAEATTMTVRAKRSSIKSDAAQDDAARLIDHFQGVDLDDTARAEIAATLAACASRLRETSDDYDNADVTSFTAYNDTPLWLGSFEPPHGWQDDPQPFDSHEQSCQAIGAEHNRINEDG